MKTETTTVTKVEQGVLLLDRYDEAADMLKKSFRSAGFEGPVLVIVEDGFLPEDVLSIYRWFCRESSGSDQAGNGRNKPRFFNQIELPDYWEIKGNAASGEVYDLQHLRGRIFYHSHSGQRLVREVDWMNEAGVVRYTDHYDRYGILFGRTVFNRKGERFCRTWFDGEGRERIVENHVTGDILVSRGGRTSLFKNRTQLAVAALREIGGEGQRIFYNSLSTPLFVTEQLRKPRGGNSLFWQEKPREDIPGNMQMILEGHSHTDRIFVQNRDSYEKLVALGATESCLQPLGFSYEFARENGGSANALVCTNSDQIEQLDILVMYLPEVTFHIAAITEMSAKLLAFGKYENVRLYPSVRQTRVDALFSSCDLYFDINHGGEILSAVKRAFLNNQLIFGFSGTLHEKKYMTKENIYTEAKAFCEGVHQTLQHPEQRRQLLRRQRKEAMSEPTERYQALIRP